ncbi:MAG: hypothetical protein ACJA2M_000896 [Polaribacter sp.]|jgi:hypothetical protein
MDYCALDLMNKNFEHFNATVKIQIEKIKEDITEVSFIIKINKKYKFINYKYLK